MVPFDSIATSIIKEQERIVGPLAWVEAKKVTGLEADEGAKNAHVNDPEPKKVIDRLVSQYERLFGRASHEVCREAAASLLPSLNPGEVPASLAA